MAAWGREKARHLPPPGFFKKEEIYQILIKNIKMMSTCSIIYVSIQYSDPQLGQAMKIFLNNLRVMRFKVLMVVTIKSTIFWDGSLVDVYQRLES